MANRTTGQIIGAYDYADGDSTWGSSTNENFRRIDAMAFNVAHSLSNSAPSGLTKNETVLVGPSPTGAFAGHANQIGYYDFTRDAWYFYNVPNGMVFNTLDGSTWKKSASGWEAQTSGGTGDLGSGVYVIADEDSFRSALATSAHGKKMFLFSKNFTATNVGGDYSVYGYCYGIGAITLTLESCTFKKSTAYSGASVGIICDFTGRGSVVVDSTLTLDDVIMTLNDSAAYSDAGSTPTITLLNTGIFKYETAYAVPPSNAVPSFERSPSTDRLRANSIASLIGFVTATSFAKTDALIDTTGLGDVTVDANFDGVLTFAASNRNLVGGGFGFVSSLGYDTVTFGGPASGEIRVYSDFVKFTGMNNIVVNDITLYIKVVDADTPITVSGTGSLVVENVIGGGSLSGHTVNNWITSVNNQSLQDVCDVDKVTDALKILGSGDVHRLEIGPNAFLEFDSNQQIFRLVDDSDTEIARLGVDLTQLQSANINLPAVPDGTINTGYWLGLDVNKKLVKQSNSGGGGQSSSEWQLARKIGTAPASPYSVGQAFGGLSDGSNGGMVRAIKCLGAYNNLRAVVQGHQDGYASTKDVVVQVEESSSPNTGFATIGTTGNVTIYRDGGSIADITITGLNTQNKYYRIKVTDSTGVASGDIINAQLRFY